MKVEKFFLKIMRAVYPIIVYLFIRYMIATIVQYALVYASTAKLVLFGFDFSTITTTAQFNEFLRGCSIYLTMLMGLILIPVFYLMYRRDGNAKSKFFKLPKFADIVKIVILTGAAGIALNNLIALSNIASLSKNFAATQEALYSVGIVAEIIGSGIIAAVSEELVFRGVLYERLRHDFGVYFGAIASAVIFGVLHGNIVQFIYAGVIGLILTFIYEKYKTLSAPIIAHMATNVIAIILSETGALRTVYSTMTGFMIVTVVCGAVSLFMLGNIAKK